MNTFYRLASLTETRFSENEDYSRIWIYCVCFKIGVRNQRIGRGFLEAVTMHLPDIHLIPLHIRSTKFARGTKTHLRMEM